MNTDKETFWDGYLVGIVTVILLLGIIMIVCHYCGHPVFVFEQAQPTQEIR